MRPHRPRYFCYALVALFLLTTFSFSPPKPHNQQQSVYIPLAAQSVSVQAPADIQAPTGRGSAFASIFPGRSQAPPSGRESQAPPEPDYFPELRKFAEQVSDGDPEMVRGVYVPGLLALPVIQQPAGEAAYVSEEKGLITQFQSAARYNVTGLLAHNYLSGQLFFQLKYGQDVYIIMGDGDIRHYRVNDIQEYQKLNPNSLRSNLVDLETGKKMTTSEVFSRVYRGDHKVTFQTCLAGEGSLNWGLIFITAQPVGAGN